MDVPIPIENRQKQRCKRNLLILGVAFILAAATFGFTRLKPAPPRVERASIWTDSVRRGDMLRQVRGSGTLVPEGIRWVPTLSAGRVERIIVLPGSVVESNTILVELSNPELEQAAFGAESQLKAARADLTNLRVQLESQKLTQRAAVANAQAGSTAANLDFETNEALGRDGLVPAITVKQSRMKAEQLAALLDIEHDRLRICSEAATAQLAAQGERIAQLEAAFNLKRTQVSGLRIRAGMTGILQRLGEAGTLELGQQMAASQPVARIADPTRLKAVIHVPETQARDIQLNQPATIDTRNGTVPAHVGRIAPAVENGAVGVELTPDAALPRGARPDLTVDGTIELERLENVLHIARPVQAQPEGTCGIFKLEQNGKIAVRFPVRFGRSSVASIEILAGLQEGDQIVLSDMSHWDSYERIRLE